MPLTSRRTVFVAGSGRSGTTWLQEVIDFRHDHQVLFEPFWPRKVPIAAAFGDWPCARPDDGDHEKLIAATEILEGRVHNAWIDQAAHREGGRHVLVKEIRANLMLGWLHRNFPQIRFVYIVRDPHAVVSSQLRLGWHLQPDEVRARELCLRDVLGTPLGETPQPTDGYEVNLKSWCIDNMIPIRQAREGWMHLVRYECLLRDPEREIRRIFDFLGVAYDPLAAEQALRPSRLTAASEALPRDRIADARPVGEGGTERIRRTADMLKSFGLDHVYGAEPNALSGCEAAS